MPLYEFECHNCGTVKEVVQPFDKGAPDCCDTPMKRIIGNITTWFHKGSIPVTTPPNSNHLAKKATNGWEMVHSK